jgi:hypothetical protein
MSLYKTVYLSQIRIKVFFQKHFVQYVMSNQNYYLWKHKAADPLYFTRRHRFILTSLGTNDSSLKNLQREQQFFKISIPYTSIL